MTDKYKIPEDGRFPEGEAGDAAAVEFATAVLQNGMEFGATISEIVAPLMIHPFTRMSGFLAAACVASVAARKPDAKEENRETLHLMLNIILDHCEGAREKASAARDAALAAQKKGMI